MNKLCSNDSAISLVDVLSNQDFENLLSLFHSSDYPDGCIQLESFKAILEQILNIPKSDKRIDILCKKIDIDEDGVVDENKLITYFLQQFQEREAIRAVRLLPFQESPSFIQNIYSKQSTCQIMHLYNPSRFISISKDGVIATWSSNLQLQKGTIVDDKAAIIDHNEFSRSKKRNIWISDATIIDTYNLLVISTTSRELNFYDITSNVYKCIYRLCDIPSLPICLSSHVDPDDKTCYIFIGDSNGSISIFHFTNPLVSLFAQSIKEPSEFDNAQIVMHSRLSDHSEYVTCTFVHNVHADWILQIKYLPQNHSTITCAQSHQNSVVLRDIEGKRKPYQFNLKKGVTCFDFNWKLNLLITGSSDHIIRFWDPYVPTIPTAILKEHTSPIIDVLINIDMNIVFSFSRDLVMCAWDIYEHTLLQTVSVKFPFSQRQPEFSSTVLFLLSPTKLAVTCNEYISVYPLGDTSATIRKGVVMSHAKPLIGATYDPRLQQVVSGCENGDVNVWDINSGSKTYNFKNCHNNTEVTFTSLDGNNRYLITGSRLGEVKVWNYSNGECLHEMHTLDNTEITGVVHVPDKAQYLAAGWNRRISSYTIKPNIYTLQPDGIWSTDVPHHSDDILTIAYCPPYYMATGSFDGDITVWNIDTTVPFARFKTITQIKATINLKLSRKQSSLPLSRSSVASASRPASRQLLHRNQSIVNTYIQNVPVDKLLFLKQRMNKRRKLKHQSEAVLVSSEGGNCRFWSFPGEKESRGCFPLTRDNECVLALSSDVDNNCLIMGDTAGFITVFDISTYCVVYETSNPMPPATLNTWRAHDKEILSVEYITHENQQLILSSSADCTVRLWNMEGDFIGTFGQNQLWHISDSATFQHPLTPWGDAKPLEVDKTLLATSVPVSGKSSCVSISTRDEDTLEQGKELNSTPTPSESSSSIAATSQPSLFDNKLSDQYANKANQRLAERVERRHCYEQYASEKLGSSTFQALQLSHINELKVPKTISELLEQ